MKRNISEKYLCHDELLYDLYNLDLTTAKYKVINEVPYLVNTIKKDKYEIGFKHQLSNKLPEYVKDDTLLVSIDEIIDSNETFNFKVSNVLEQYGKYMCLSNIEKYLINVLLDKYFYNTDLFSISLKEIEINYRENALSRRNIVINDETYNRYIDTINLLCNKQLFIKTKASFRNKIYGVNDIEATDRLLKIIDVYKDGSNNIRFSYSFGVLGKILKNSKRYSTLAPAEVYRISFKQLKSHLAAMYVARILYIENGYRLKNSNIYRKLEIDPEEVIAFIEDPFKPVKTNRNRYSNSALKYTTRLLEKLKKYRRIYDYEVIEELEYRVKSKTLTKEDEEREIWLKELDEFHGEKQATIPNRLIKSVIIFPTAYDKECYSYEDMLKMHKVM